MVCPKCGFSQPDDYYCANCGVNIEKYAQRKRKKRGYAFGIAIVFLSIGAIAVTRYVQTSHRNEKAKSVSETGYEKSGPASKRTVQTEPKIERKEGVKRSSERRVASRPEAKGKLRPSRPAVEGRSERGPGGAPTQKAEEEVKSRRQEVQLTASQWFEKGRELDDDSELEMESYLKAVKLDPKFAPAYYYLGAIYYRRADYERAEAEFVKFLQHASEEERIEYDIYLYYSDEDLEGLLEIGEQASQTTKEASGEAGPEVVAEEAGEVDRETVGEEPGSERSDEREEEVQTIVKFTSHNGQILVPVVLNGSVSTNVLLDTGSGMTIISTELARDVGLKVARDRGIKLRTIASDVQAVLGRLDSIELGDLRRDNFPVAVSDLKLGEQRRFDGILGMDFLNNYAIHIDNMNSRILLRPSGRQ